MNIKVGMICCTTEDDQNTVQVTRPVVYLLTGRRRPTRSPSLGIISGSKAAVYPIL